MLDGGSSNDISISGKDPIAHVATNTMCNTNTLPIYALSLWDGPA